MDIKPREMMLEPWLPCQGLAMLHARRGAGKTYLALSIGYAVASGGSVLGWQAPKPRKVCYLDGEMLAALLQERLAGIVKGSEREPQPEMFNILTPDLQKGFMPDLATIGGQAALAEVMPADTGLIIVDSLSSLMRGEARENDAESWQPIAAWALAQRVAGRSVLFLHHDNRRGEQRGTSKKEDALDTVLALRPPADYQANAEARFEIHIEKSRTLCAGFSPVEAELITTAGAGGITWRWKALQQTLAERIRQMAETGMKNSEIAEELRLNRSTVYRVLSRVERDGL
jgi:RecA-family ATPase